MFKEKAGVLKVLLLGGLAAGCGNSPEFSAPSKVSDPPSADARAGERMVQTFIVQASTPLDLVLAVDTSSSMLEEIANLETNMQGFIDSLSDAQLDTQVTILAKQTNATDPRRIGTVLKAPKGLDGKLVLIDQYIHSVDAIGHLSAFFQGEYGFPLPLRDDSLIEAVIVSDDNGSNDILANIYETPGNLADEFKPPQGRAVTVNAIVGLKVGTDPNNTACQVKNVGEQFIKLQKNTGGALIDICMKDWSQLLKQLSTNIASRRLSYNLTNKPDIAEEIVVKVDGQPVDPANYQIDADAQTLRFNPDYKLAANAEVVVEYYYTTTP